MTGAEIFWQGFYETYTYREADLGYVDECEKDGNPWSSWHESTFTQSALFNERAAYLADMGVI